MVARAYASLCLTSAADKRQREALRFKDLALSSCKVLGEQGLLSNTLTVAAVNEAGQGSWSAAVSNLNQAIEISGEIGDTWQWEEATSHMAHLEFYRGNFAKSRSLYDQARPSPRPRPHPGTSLSLALGLSLSLSLSLTLSLPRRARQPRRAETRR